MRTIMRSDGRRAGRGILAAGLAALVAACGAAGDGESPDAPSEDGASWTEVAPLPDARTEVSVTTDGRRILLFGGFGPPSASGDGEGPTSPRALRAYDPAEDAWTALDSIPEGLNHSRGTVLDGKLYVVGGYREATFTPTGAVRIYDLETGQWSEGASMPTPRGALAVAVVDGRIHTFGGTVAEGSESPEGEGVEVASDGSVNVHEVYDPASDTWSSAPPMPTPRNHHAAVTLGSRVHVVAGRAEGDYRLRVHEIYDPASGTWSDGPPIPTGRSGIGIADLDGKAYVFGGEDIDGGRTFDAAERYDPAAGAWETLPPMPTARHGLGAATVDGAVYVVSGGPEPGFSYGTANERLEVEPRP